MGSYTSPYEFVGMSDGQLIELAANCLQRAAMLPPGSPRRAIRWAKFTAAFGEYKRREDERAKRLVARVRAS